jgi:hypothetical protein
MAKAAAFQDETRYSQIAPYVIHHSCRVGQMKRSWKGKVERLESKLRNCKAYMQDFLAETLLKAMHAHSTSLEV